jgi:hypothetical protein
MGYYIETGTNLDKANILVKNQNAQIIDRPSAFKDGPKDKALICVVNNGPFEAAAYCYSEREFLDFNDPSDFRRKQWLIMDKELAKKLSGCNQ